MNISELRANEIGLVMDLACACDVTFEDRQIMHTLSLLARDGEAPHAAAVCCRLENGDYELVLFGEGLADNLPLARQMVDKALLKTRRAGVQKCAIQAPQFKDDSFWKASAWAVDEAA